MSEDDGLYLGRAELDQEHQGQLDLLRAMEVELEKGGDQGILVPLVDQLIAFTDVHFMSEQLLMRQHSYPGFGPHEADHERLMEQVLKLQSTVRSGEQAVSLAELNLLRDWVAEHIRKMDLAFSLFLAKSSEAGQ
ncbi:MAG TPA: hemerythrin family protein [Rhodospirillaceae bacterium]|nr:hemerythrin family protein [Rhodospirillaceae bacterium]